MYIFGVERNFTSRLECFDFVFRRVHSLMLLLRRESFERQFVENHTKYDEEQRIVDTSNDTETLKLDTSQHSKNAI